MQTTLNKSISFEGVGLHSGKDVVMTLVPSEAGHGISFERADLAADSIVPALWKNVLQGPLNTKIENDSGVSISTIEHIMAALAGCGVNNLHIVLDGPEVPILDGSSAPFVQKILETGLLVQDEPLFAIKVIKPVRVDRGSAWAQFLPADNLEIDFVIDFDDAAIGHQEKHLDMANGAFVRELSDSRTFCRKRDVDAMHDAGLALGGSYENAVVVDGENVLSPGGLRHDDEAVRHKMLDVLGDLNTAGHPILGRYQGHRAGHALTNALLRALFDDRSAYQLVPCTREVEDRLPGAHVVAEDLRDVSLNSARV